MEKKLEIIPLLPYRAGSLNLNGEENSTEGSSTPDTKLHLNKCQVVRKEFLPHKRDLSLTFSDMRFYVSKSCLSRFPNVNTVLTLIDPVERLLILMPCDENTPNALVWCIHSNGKPIPRKSASPVLYGMIFDLMQWELNTRYRILGRVVYEDEKTFLAFDLKNAEVFPRAHLKDNTYRRVRRAQYQETWREQFGVSYGEQVKMVNLKFFGEYSAFSAVKCKPARLAQAEQSFDEMREDVTRYDE